jgi:hypothetical protein
MTAMGTLLEPPVATTFEMVAAAVSAALYLLVGIAVLARAPKDIRARLFFLTALASAPAYLLTVLLWARGYEAAMQVAVMVVVGVSLAMGSLTLFHFTQVFPWRRPWIRSYWTWLLIAYLVVPFAVALPIWILGPVIASMVAPDAGAGGLGAVSAGISEFAALAVLLIGLPLVFVIGIVVPFGALMSLYKTWNETRIAGPEPARITTFWILISQMAGGVLAILIIPLLRLVAPIGPWVTMAAALLFAFGLLMPLAFAAGVWTYRVLELDSESPPGRRSDPLVDVHRRT